MVVLDFLLAHFHYFVVSVVVYVAFVDVFFEIVAVDDVVVEVAVDFVVVFLVAVDVENLPVVDGVVLVVETVDV